MGSNGSGIRTQLSADPLKMAPAVKKIIGAVKRESRLERWWNGGKLAGDQEDEIIKRMEYAAVQPVATKNRITEMILYGLNKIVSRIKSFE
jgi:hypothetical protein